MDTSSNDEVISADLKLAFSCLNGADAMTYCGIMMLHAIDVLLRVRHQRFWVYVASDRHVTACRIFDHFRDIPRLMNVEDEARENED